MTQNSEVLEIIVLNQKLQIKLPPGQNRALIESARFFESEVKKMIEANKSIDLNRAAIMTGINMTYEYLKTKSNQSKSIDMVNYQIRHLKNKIHKAIKLQEEIEL